MLGWIALASLILMAVFGDPAQRLRRLICVGLIVALGLINGLFIRTYPDSEWAKIMSEWGRFYD